MEKIKTWFCPNCFKRKETENNVLFASCKCGEFMIIEKKKGEGDGTTK